MGSIMFSSLLEACSPGRRIEPDSETAVKSPTAGLTPENPENISISVSPTQTQSTTVNVQDQEPLPTLTEVSQPAEKQPDLVVVRQGEPENLVRKAIDALGGIERFVQSGANVIVKPNICVGYSYEYAATTNPWVVGTLVKMCYEAGASHVQVMDYPFGCSAQQGYKASGIQEQVEEAGGEMVFMTPTFKYVKTAIPQGIDLKEIKVYEDVLKADVVINVPIAKDHSDTRLTLGMKNLMGVILNRNTMHFNLGQRIADLASLIRPQLTVVDAIRILTANGPSGGGNLNNVKKIDTIIAGQDFVAVDSYAASLFGLQPEDIGYIEAGASMGLGRSDLQNLEIAEISGVS